MAWKVGLLMALRVLILCTGNRWRSPLLAHCFREARPSWEVRSAGTRCGRPGAEVPGAWRACVPGWVESHQATRMTVADVAWADVIVGVQRSHETAVRAFDVGARVIIHRLPDPAFAPVASWPSLVAAILVAVPDLVASIDAICNQS